MQEVNLILSENPSFKFVAVKFQHENGKYESKVYTYKTHEDFEPGDLALVDSPFGGIKTVEVQKVLRPHEVEGQFRFKWVVQKVDTACYNKLNDAEDKIINTLATHRANKLKSEMYKELTAEIGKKAILELKKLVG